MMRRVAKIGGVLVLSVSLGASGAPPEGSWTQPYPPLETTVNPDLVASITRYNETLIVDLDGNGPEPETVFVATDRGVFSWDGAVWRQVGVRNCTSLAVVKNLLGDPEIVGAFARDDGFTEIRRYDPHFRVFDLEPFGGDSALFNGDVRSIKGFDPDGAGPNAERIVVVGSFNGLLNGAQIAHVAQYNRGSDVWQAMGSGINNTADVVACTQTIPSRGAGEDLIIGGFFTEAGGQPADLIARWNGADWEPYTSGITSFGEGCP